MSLDQQKIALTQTVQKGGCAAKVAASELRRILKNVQFPQPHAALLVDGGLFDDAAIYKVTEDIALVQTLDFFTPIVDTPRLFGEIAAANALSDVYAMGGRPKTAMGILAFPIATLPDQAVIDVMQGASDKIAEAGANFVGGHSIDDETLKFGLSVTGFVDPHRVWSNAGAQVGDHLILTKPLGAGTMTAALKRQELSEEAIMEALLSMASINNAIDFISPDLISYIHGATDITGFGLSGHCMQLAQASQVSLKINLASLPLFKKTMECLEKGYLTKAHRSNSQYTEKSLGGRILNPLEIHLINDPQTSGGLLLSVSPEFSGKVLSEVRRKFAAAQIIGEVLEQNESAVNFA